MASRDSEIDDGDLIDLGTGLCVISHGGSSNSSSGESGPFDSSEEQEHLLDVCPPKLEQKLSLTGQQRRDAVLGEVDGVADVLVTLGHDKVVPIAKRIDVVSSDTIKRVKDITKNLEPVIQNQGKGNDDPRIRIQEVPFIFKGVKNEGDDIVDAPELRREILLKKDESESFETQEINNAFNFLTELEDCEEEVDDDDDDDYEDPENRTNDSISSDGPLMDQEFDYALAIADFHTVVDVEIESEHRNDIKKIHRSHSNDYFDYLQRQKEKSIQSPSKKRSRTLPANSRSKQTATEFHDRNDIHILEDDFPIQGKVRERNATKIDDRKSWSEGAHSLQSKPGNRFGRSLSLEIRTEQEERPSTSESSNCRRSLEPIVNSAAVGGDDNPEPPRSKSGSSPSSSPSSSSSSSCTSEVDWSWVDEVESRSRSGRAVSSSIGGRCWLAEEEETSPTIVDLERMRPAGNPSCRSTDSTAMSGLPVAKSSPVPGPPGAPQPAEESLTIQENGTTAVAGNSWIRASMRRLRHLRLPEAEDHPGQGQSSASFSAPNSLPDIALIAPEILAAHTNGTTNSSSASSASSSSSSAAAIGTVRPASAPTPRSLPPAPSTTPARGRLPAGRSRGRGNNSRRESLRSRNTITDTSCSTSSGTSTATSPTSSPNATPQHPSSSPRRVCDRQRGADRDDERGEDDDEDENPLGRWPHALSPALACLGCTLGLFNISRFAILSIQFGANFIVQFLVLSLVLGIPLFTLHVCLGQRLAAGAVDMWKISPLFQGVGIALLTAHAFIGIYSIVGISWMFVYFRDSFITKQDRYQWAEPSQFYRDDSRSMQNGTTYKLQETVPDYFSGAVLQRHHLNEPGSGIVTLKFQVAFNLAVVWMIVFVSLSKGLRSYGKVVYVFTLLPVFGTLVLCAKLLGLTPTGSIHQLFPETVWSEFFINGKSWMAASSEVFLTWGLFGAAAMQIAAHNKHKHLLQRDTSLVVVLTFVVLLLSAFLANTCVQILRHHRYVYTTSSFEGIPGYSFMHLVNQQVHRGQVTTPERFMNHASFLAGQRVVRPGADLSSESGYQVLRLATELVPATLAILGSEQVSPFWAVLFYFILILFGIAQQLAIWHCVITGIMAINAKMMKLWETTITFFSCACGYILGLPMATEFGIYVVYYLDYTVGGAWWIMVLYLVEVGAVFAVRGRPHTGEAVVAELFPPTGRCLRHWAGPLLSFTWNVVLPVALMVLSIMIFKSSGYRELYTYRRTNKDYWSVWARQLGAAIQLIPILTIPVVAIIQTCRYLNSGPPDIFDRIQLLYRPSLEPEDPADQQPQVTADTSTSIHGDGVLPSTTEVPFEDPPPKYTPPPSYTTATGARIAKMLRQSFRRSVRRIANVLGESSGNPRSRPALQPPPPDYAAVLVEMNQGIPTRDISIIVTEVGPDVTDHGPGRSGTLDRRRPNTIDRTMRIGAISDRQNNERSNSYSTMDRSRERRAQPNNGSSNLTAADVANLLRSSIRRGNGSRNQQSSLRSFSTAAVSIENLVEAAAPIGQDSLVLPKDESLVLDNGFNNDDDDDKKTADQTDNTTTVI